MEDLKDILIFIGLKPRIFLINLLWYFLLFFLVIGLTIVMFFLNYRFIRNSLFFGLFVLLLFFTNFILKKSFYLKNQMVLNEHYLNYLKNKISPDKVLESGYVHKGDLLNKVKKSNALMGQTLKKSRAGYLTRKIFLALSTLNLTNRQLTVFPPEFIKKIRLLIRKQVVIEMSLIGSLLLPFALISVLLSWGLWPGLKLLIFLMAAIFVYFLYSSLFEPIVFLYIQKKIFEIQT